MSSSKTSSRIEGLTPPHQWAFRTRFRRRGFGWKSQPAIKRVKEAVAEIKKVARKDRVLAAEGAVLLMERLSPALEQVDGSSGAIGSAVNHAIVTLVPIIASAPVEDGRREQWLKRLFAAHRADEMPYIERLADYWGELCASPVIAARWADELIDMTRRALAPERSPRAFFHGTTACLAALFAAGRYDELLELLQHDRFWPYQRWAARALAERGNRAAAIRLAEACRGSGYVEQEIDQFCEQLLLSSGLVDEAYQRYGLRAHRATTYAGWFRAVRKRYPDKPAAEVLADLVAETSGEEGKWFAAAKDAKLFDQAISLANLSPCDPKTLIRAARDYAQTQPAFAIEAGIAALRWMVEGYGYEITNADVLNAYTHTTTAAANVHCAEATELRIRELVAAETFGDRFVTQTLGPRLGIA